MNAFIAEHILTLDDLYVLVLLALDARQWWDAASVASRLGLTVTQARKLLDRFVSHNLFDICVSDDVRYRYEPGTTTLRADADVLVEAFRRAPSDVMCDIPAGRPARLRRLFRRVPGDSS